MGHSIPYAPQAQEGSKWEMKMYPDQTGDPMGRALWSTSDWPNRCQNGTLCLGNISFLKEIPINTNHMILKFILVYLSQRNGTLC